MIRVLLVDDHPALRAGLATVLKGEPGLVPVAAVASAREALEEVGRREVTVAVLDYHLPGEDGLLLCQRLKALPEPPRVLVYSAYAETGFVIPATIAGADGIANKGAPAEELFEAIRLVAKGSSVLPPSPPEMLEAAVAKLDDEEQAIFELLMERRPCSEVATTLGLAPERLGERVREMIGKLGAEFSPEVGQPTAAESL